MMKLSFFFVICVFLQAEGLTLQAPAKLLPVSLPSVSVPKVTVPKISLPSVTLPTLSDVKLPSLSPSVFSLQEFNGVLQGTPICNFEGQSGSCCAVVYFHLLNKKFDNCITFGIKEEKLAIGLTINGKQIIQTEVDSKHTTPCFPVPSVPLRVCLDVYHFEASTNEKSVNACAKMSLRPTVTGLQLVDLNVGCVKYQDGELKRNNDFSPESKGVLNVDFADGKIPKLSLGGLSSLYKPKA